MTSQKPKVAVVGSLNLDYIAGVEHLPVPGETVAAYSVIRRFGGKGANQAVAAARQGASVALIGCVSADKDGETYREHLRLEGIDTKGISLTSKALTGTALIAVDRQAENTIIVGAGANRELTTAEIRRHSLLITSANVILLQFEIPVTCILETIRIANRSRVPVVLNPSPLQDFPWGECALDTIIANTGEASSIFKQSVTSTESGLARLRRALTQKRVACLVVTRGAEPTICITAQNYFEIPAMKIKPVDTVGAGDAFAGTFAAWRAGGADLKKAVCYANCAGALTTLKSGAQESMPNRLATERAWRANRSLFKSVLPISSHKN